MKSQSSVLRILCDQAMWHPSTNRETIHMWLLTLYLIEK
jgi:hypothetical protein